VTCGFIADKLYETAAEKINCRLALYFIGPLLQSVALPCNPMQVLVNSIFKFMGKHVIKFKEHFIVDFIFIHILLHSLADMTCQSMAVFLEVAAKEAPLALFHRLYTMVRLASHQILLAHNF
jgi:hypothetical protein